MKLYEFVDKLYAMGDTEAPKTTKPKKVLNESLNEDIQNEKQLTEAFVRQWFPSNEDYFYDDLSGIVEIKKLDTRYDDITDEEQTLYEFSGTKDAFQHIVDNFGYFEDLEYQKKYQDDELEYSDDIANLQYSDDFYEGLGAGALSESLKPEDLVPGEVYNHKTIPYMDKD
jgi:hypothetical protein